MMGTAGLVSVRRLAWRAWFTVRSSVRGMAFGMLAGVLMAALLPLQHIWLPAVAGAGLAFVFALCLVAGGALETRRGVARETDPRGMTRTAVLENSNTPQQFGHAFGTASLTLVSVSLGAWLAGALGL